MLEGGRLASGSGDETIKIWDVATSGCVMTLEGHEGTMFSLAVLEDSRLASGSGDKIKIWDVAAGACVATLEGRGGYVNSLAVLAGGRLASGSDDMTIKIWDLATALR